MNLNHTLSNLTCLNTGAPQGCVLFHTLSTIYTHDFKVIHPDTKPLKFADDTSIQGIMSLSDVSYFVGIERFVKWCSDNFLILNVLNTKEIMVDFRILKNKFYHLFQLMTNL